MQVDTNVSESDIGGIKDGDKATFTVDAFPKRTFEGTVTQVRQSPQTVQNVVTYDVVVSVDNRDLALKPGMTAATRIVIDERRDVLRVPSQALRYAPALPARPRPRPAAAGRAGSATADARRRGSGVLRDGEPVAVPVTAGLDDDSFTEIVKATSSPATGSSSAEQRDASPRPRAAAAAASEPDDRQAGSCAEPVIRVENVTRTYHVGDVDVHALRGVSLTIEPASSSPSWARPAPANRR